MQHHNEQEKGRVGVTKTYNNNNNRNKPHTPVYEHAVVNDSFIFHFKRSHILYIHSNKLKQAYVESEISILKDHVVIEARTKSIVLKAPKGKKTNIAKILENTFPNTLVRNYITNILDCRFFYDGNPNDSIRICCIIMLSLCIADRA